MIEFSDANLIPEYGPWCDAISYTEDKSRNIGDPLSASGETMSRADHYRKLEAMYLSAPINGIFSPMLNISSGQAVVSAEARNDLFHAAGALHGAVYFKMLDDAAFFAASSVVDDFFMLTKNFRLEFLRPISGGQLRSVGRVVRHAGREVECEAVLYADDKEAARGQGTFVTSNTRLEARLGYRLGETSR